MVGGAVACPTASPACPDGFCQGTGHETLRKFWASFSLHPALYPVPGAPVPAVHRPAFGAGLAQAGRKQALVMSTLSGGHHRDSDREEVPDWRGHCLYGCRSGGELRVGFLS